VVFFFRFSLHSNNWSTDLKCFSVGPLEVPDLEVRNSLQCAIADIFFSLVRGTLLQIGKLLLGKQKMSSQVSDKYKISQNDLLTSIIHLSPELHLQAAPTL
jgi:hypothetical protein